MQHKHEEPKDVDNCVDTLVLEKIGPEECIKRLQATGEWQDPEVRLKSLQCLIGGTKRIEENKLERQHTRARLKARVDNTMGTPTPTPRKRPIQIWGEPEPEPNVWHLLEPVKKKEKVKEEEEKVKEEASPGEEHTSGSANLARILPTDPDFEEKIKAHTMQARIDLAESYKGEWSLEPPKETGAGQTAPSQSSGNPRRDLAAFDSRLRYDISKEERAKAEERVKTESLAEREEENENGVDYTAPGDSSSDVED